VNVLISSCGSYLNKGDAAILLAMLDNIHRRFKNVDIYCQGHKITYTQASGKEGILRDINPKFIKFPSTIILSFIKNIIKNTIFVSKKAGLLHPKNVICRNQSKKQSKLKRMVKSYLILIDTLVAYFIPSAFFRIHPREEWRNLRGFDVIVMAGGTQLEDKEYPNYPGFVHNLPALCWAVKSNIPVFITGQTIGPIKNRLARFVTKLLLNRVTGICTREEDSYKYLKKDIRIKNPNVKVGADWAFLLRPISNEQVDYLVSQSLSNYSDNSKLIVAIIVRKGVGFHDRRSREKSDEYLTKVARVTDYIIEQKNGIVVLFPQTIDKNSQTHNDYETCCEVQSMMRNKAILPDTSEWTVGEIAGFLGKMSLLITFRMHAIILSATVGGTPAIAISHTHKFSGLMKMLGMEKLVLNTGDFTEEQLIDKIEYVLANKEQIMDTLGEKISLAQNAALENQKMISDYLH